jgi:hypothetical protein
VAIERKHQVAVLRAAWNVVSDDPAWCVIKSWRRGRGWIFCNSDSVESYGRACLRHDDGWRDRAEPENVEQLTRYAWAYAQVVQQWRAERTGETDELSVVESANFTNRETLSSPSAISARLRSLMTENDPDAMRAGLAEIADALDAMAGNAVQQEAEAA